MASRGSKSASDAEQPFIIKVQGADGGGAAAAAKNDEEAGSLPVDRQPLLTINGSSLDDAANNTHFSSSSPIRKTVRGPLYLLYRFFTSLPVQVTLVLLTLVDISFLLYEFITDDVHLAVVTLCTSLMFFLEILVVWSYEGSEVYFRNDRIWRIAEVFIVTASFLVEYTEYILEAVAPPNDFSGDLRYLRAVRFFRVLIIWKTRYRNFTAALRRLVSADRRRYQEGGYDLDLTYVHPKVIAMSWPSSKSESLYRNQIETVAAFLTEKHDKHYRVYNLCSERSYDESQFFSCARYRLDDHSPAELMVMLHFAEDVHRFISEDKKRNVAVIHCKGGKGRTGTMVCTYLLYAGIKKTADEALSHFGFIRTSDDAKSFQGVESPSQDRYVRYFERLLKCPSLKPPLRRIKLTQVIVHDVPFAWWTNGIDRLWFAVIAFPCTQRTVVYKSNPTVKFDAQLPEDPTRKRKQKLGRRQAQGGGRASVFKGGESTPADGEVATENVFSDDDTYSRRFGGDAASPHTPNQQDAAGEAPQQCMPHSDNITIFVDHNMSDPMDVATFHSRFVDGGEGSPRTNSNFAVTAMSQAFLKAPDALSPVRKMVYNAALKVSVAFDVHDIPELEEDINIRFFYNQDDPNTLQCKFQTFFYPAFEGNAMHLTKPQIDGPHKEANKEKKFPLSMELHITWEDVVGADSTASAPSGGGVTPAVPASLPERAAADTD